MKNLLIVLVFFIISSIVPVGCEKDNTILHRDITIKAYGNAEFICGFRFSSWEHDLWEKSKYIDSTIIELSHIQLPDTLFIGSWGNSLIVYSNDIVIIDTSFSNYILLTIPIE